MSFPPISPDSLDGSRMRLDVYIYIRNVQWVPKLYRRRTCFYISRISSFLLFRWIGSKNTFDTIGYNIFSFFQESITVLFWRVWIIASSLHRVQRHKNSFEIPVHAASTMLRKHEPLGDVTAWQTRVARAARVTSIRVYTECPLQCTLETIIRNSWYIEVHGNERYYLEPVKILVVQFLLRVSKI